MEHHLDLFGAVGIPYFNFALFVVAFIALFRKPLATMAAARRDAYLNASKEAAQALEVSRKAFEEVKKRFDALDQELLEFRKQSESSAHAEAKRIIEETERFTRQLKEETSKLAKDAVERARFELREEIVAAAKTLTAERVSKELDAASKDKIMKSRIAATAAMRVEQ